MIRLRSILEPLNLTSVRALKDVTKIADQSVRRQAGRVLIMRHYDRLGGLHGRMGVPMGDVRLTSGGSVKPFSGGTIELQDIGLQDISPQGVLTHRAEVRFQGFHCIKESDHDQLSPADEPYFILSVTGTNQEGRVTRNFGPYGDVDSGDDRFESEILTTRGQPPFSISVVAMENDSGSPDEAAAKVKGTLDEAADKVALALLLVGANPAIGSMIQSIENIFGGLLGDAASAIFGLGDDAVGQNQSMPFNWNADQEKWLNPRRIVETPPFGDKEYNVKLNVGDGDEGKYTLYFNVTLFEVHEVVVPTGGP